MYLTLHNCTESKRTKFRYKIRYERWYMYSGRKFMFGKNSELLIWVWAKYIIAS